VTTIRFLGACGTVTGSRFVLDGSCRVMVDCGLFQGPRSLRRRNWDPLPLDPRAIDDVVLTHAHLDHSGYLPVLARSGLRATVRATASTAALAGHVLRDSAHLQAEDAEYAAAHGYSKHDPPLALYDEDDVERLVGLISPVLFGVDVALSGGASLSLRPAGHILGSASAIVEMDGVRVVFSGDLGRSAHPLLSPPAPRQACDVVVVESTYGNRRHPDDELTRLGEVISRTLRRGGSVLIPAFAVDRTEIVLHSLRRLREAGAVPDAPVFVDSPMALAALEVYRRAIAAGAPDLRPDLPEDPFGLDEVRLAATVEESIELNSPRRPSIIVSASGMVSGGRVVHHLAALAPDRRNSLVLVGFQAPGTRGSDLAQGATQIKALGRYVQVRCDVEVFAGMSVHADADDVLDWLAGPARATSAPSQCFVVHGELESAEALAARIRTELGWLTAVPEMREIVRLA
jgi:metallo-beta-lactamase family protein